MVEYESYIHRYTRDITIEIYNEINSVSVSFVLCGEKDLLNFRLAP